MTVYAGVDYGEVLKQAEEEADVIVWDGGDNDFPFFAPDLLVVVVDPLRPGHELRYHPGETNLRMADVVVVNKVDSADAGQRRQRRSTPCGASTRTRRSSSRRRRVTLGHGPPLYGKRVLVVEDGPTITHGEMPFGAGKVAALEGGASVIVDPRAYAVGSHREAYGEFPHSEASCRRWATRDEQLHELEETINATPMRRRRHGNADRPRHGSSGRTIRSGTRRTSSRRSVTRPWKTCSSR